MGLDPATAGSFFDHPRINTSIAKYQFCQAPQHGFCLVLS